MRKLLILGVILLAGGCSKYDPSEPVQRGGVLYFFTDTDTGCEYLSHSSGGGITPRMGVDGKQVCRRPK